ncbi:acyl-CoA dehydrogenase [Marmoricola sp. URHA0025 HA25]
MDFQQNPLHKELRESVLRLCQPFDDHYWMEHDESKEFPDDFWRAVADAGWFGLTVPEEYGGGGLGIAEAAVVEQALAESGGGMNACSAVHIGIFGFEPILKYGSEELKARFLARMISGDLHIAFGVTEPDAGTETTNISTFARKVDGGYLVTGKKVFITKAQSAERILLLTRTAARDAGAKRTDGMTVFFAPMDRDKILVRPIPKMGRNAVDTNELFIDELFVPDEDVVGDVGRGFEVIIAGLNAERILSANAALGIGRAALRRAVTYANERVVFGRPIGQNQGIAWPLAEARMKLEAADLVLQKAAWLLDNGLPCAEEANMGKYLAAEAANFAADHAVGTHGGYGFAKEFHVERYFREARLHKLAPVSQQMVLNYVSERVLGLPRSY